MTPEERKRQEKYDKKYEKKKEKVDKRAKERILDIKAIEFDWIFTAPEGRQFILHLL